LAIKECSMSIDLDPTFALSYNNLGLAYGAKKEYDKCIDNCTKAIELDPLLAEAYVTRAAALSDKKMDKAAIQDCTKAIEINPNLFEAWHCRAAIYCLMKEFDKARSDLEMCRKIGGTISPMLLELIKQR